MWPSIKHFVLSSEPLTPHMSNCFILLLLCVLLHRAADTQRIALAQLLVMVQLLVLSFVLAFNYVPTAFSFAHRSIQPK